MDSKSTLSVLQPSHDHKGQNVLSFFFLFAFLPLTVFFSPPSISGIKLSLLFPPPHTSLTCLSNYSSVSRFCSCCLSLDLQPISHQLKWERIDSSSIGLKQAPSSSPTCICFFPFTTKCTDSSSNTSNLLKFQNPQSLALIKMFLVESLPLSPAVLPSSYSLQAPFTLSYNLVPIYLEFFAFHNAMLPFLAAVQEDKTPQGSGTASFHNSS